MSTVWSRPLRLWLVTGLLLLTAPTVFSIDIYIAPLVIIDEAGSRALWFAHGAPERVLSEDLGSRAFDGKVVVHRAAFSKDMAPRSLLEALRLSDSAGYEYLLYGYIRRTDDAYFAELKLLDVKARSVTAVFFSGDGKDHYERLLGDLSTKIAAYFKEVLDAGPGRRANEPDEEHAWSLPASIGYWTPISAEWNKALSGIIRAKVGVRFWPRRPAYIKDSRKRQLGFGSDLEYTLGLASPGLEEAIVNTALWRIVGDFVIENNERSDVGYSVGPFLRVDWLSQSRKYASPRTDTSTGVGLGIEGWYSYRVAESLTLGFCLGLDLSLYATPLAIVTPGIRMEYKFSTVPKEADNAD